MDDIPESSKLLLEIDYDNLMKSSIHNKTYWVVATEAAIKAGQKKADSEVRKRTQYMNRQQRSTRERERERERERDCESLTWRKRLILIAGPIQ